MAVNVDSIEYDPFYFALMKKINAADLKQKVAQTINQSMRRINAKHMEVQVSGPFQNKINGKSQWIVVLGNNGQTWLIKPEFVTGTFVNTNLGQTVFGSVFRRIMEGHPNPSKDFFCVFM